MSAAAAPAMGGEYDSYAYADDGSGAGAGAGAGAGTATFTDYEEEPPTDYDPSYLPEQVQRPHSHAHHFTFLPSFLLPCPLLCFDAAVNGLGRRRSVRHRKKRVWF